MLIVANDKGEPFPFSETLPVIIPLFLAAVALIEIIKIKKNERNLLYIVVVKIEYIVKHNILFTPLDED
ncbi:hypothetical protein MASR1M46_00530 [Bacteroidales bacterium]